MLTLVAACASSPPAATTFGPKPDETPAGVSDPLPNVAPTFEFDSLDDRPVTSAATRGKPTVLLFVQTGDVWSQAQVNFLVAMAKNDGTSVNYLLVAIEPRTSRELVERYRGVLGVAFPTALADDNATLMGAGPFGLLKVPATLVLDRQGRVVWKVEGRVAKPAEIRPHMKGL